MTDKLENKDMANMNIWFQRARIVLALLCLCSVAPIYGQSTVLDEAKAEQQFNTQMIGALSNDPKAQFNVAQMYQQGVGIPQDLGMAHMWYTKSANQGYAPAIKLLTDWDREQAAAKKNAELQARQRVEEKKRREAEALAKVEEQKRREAEAIAQNLEIQKRRQAEARAARQRAEEQKRREAEARNQAAAEAKAAQNAEEQQRRQAEAKVVAEHVEKQKRDAAESAAAIKAHQTVEAKTKTGVKEKPIKADKPENNRQNSGKKSVEKNPVFKANPCETVTAKFTSTCQ
ncbi:MAG: tetratricopeptide repeat protein [Sulfuricaulis sp.]